MTIKTLIEKLQSASGNDWHREIEVHAHIEISIESSDDDQRLRQVLTFKDIQVSSSHPKSVVITLT